MTKRKSGEGGRKKKTSCDYGENDGGTKLRGQKKKGARIQLMKSKRKEHSCFLTFIVVKLVHNLHKLNLQEDYGRNSYKKNKVGRIQKDIQRN